MSRPARKRPSLNGVRVLLVEDHEDTREVVAYSLQACGATTVGAGSAEAALVEAQRSAFDVVVADLGLPDRDGIWLVEEMRARGMTMTAIAMTGLVGDDMKARCVAAGFVAFMKKPADVDLLCHAIAGLVRHAE